MRALDIAIGVLEQAEPPLRRLPIIGSHGIYFCVRCERLCCYCFGAADDMPAVCDECFCAIGHVEDDEVHDVTKAAEA